MANYPLVEEDFESNRVCRDRCAAHADRCFGILTTATAAVSQVRGERRPGSSYASITQCSYELRRAEAMFRAHRIPSINSAGDVRGGDGRGDHADPEAEPRSLRRSRGRGAAPMASSNIEWFADLGHRRCRPGGRQERVAGRDGEQPGRRRGTGARRVRDDRRGVPCGSCPTPGWPTGSTGCWTIWTSTTPVSCRGSVRRSVTAVEEQAFPRGPGEGHPRGVRQAGRRWTMAGCRWAVRSSCHRGGPAGRLVRRAAGDLPQREGHRQRPARHQAGLRLALQRPGDLLPGALGLRSRLGRAVGGGAADGALGHRRPPA